MSYSNTIPVNIVPYVRAGALAELEDAIAEVCDARRRVGLKNHREWVDVPQAWADEHYLLLELVGRPGEENTEAVELDPSGDQLPAITRALDRFERDHPGEHSAEIQALRLDVGLEFKPATERDGA